MPANRRECPYCTDRYPLFMRVTDWGFWHMLPDNHLVKCEADHEPKADIRDAKSGV